LPTVACSNTCRPPDITTSFGQDSGAAPAVDVGGGKIADALVVSAVVVVGDEGLDLGFEVAGWSCPR